MPQPHLIAAADEAGGFVSFLVFAERAGLAAMLTGPGRYTVFAPTDEAFAKLSAKLRDKLGQTALLKDVVRAHMVSGQMLSQRLQGKRIRGKSVQGTELVINGGEAISVNGALIVRPDIMAENGVLHGIDKVLWPAGALELA